jgi:Ca-activated chloride channel homolog
VIRYHLAEVHAVVAATPLDVTDVTAKVEVAPTVAPGGDVTVKWSGPNEATDFVSIDAKGAPDETYGPYVYANGDPIELPVATYAVRLSKARSLGDVAVDADATKELKY